MGKKQYLKMYWQKFFQNWNTWSHRFKNHCEPKLDKLKKTKHNKIAEKQRQRELLIKKKKKKEKKIYLQSNKLTYSMNTMKKGKRMGTFKILKVKNCRARILHPEKTFFNNESEIVILTKTERIYPKQTYTRKCWRVFFRQKENDPNQSITMQKRIKSNGKSK